VHGFVVLYESNGELVISGLDQITNTLKLKSNRFAKCHHADHAEGGVSRVHPAVSVIIPCRNERNYISRCVESILKNGYSGPLDIIIIDGMSDDGTREVLQGIKAGNNGLKVLDNPLRITPIAVNLGLWAAQGDVVLIVGAHCELGPGYISTVVRQLLSHKDIGCVGGRTTPRVEGGAIKEAIAAVLGSRFGVGNSYFRILGSKVREVDTVAFGAYRREVFEKIGWFDERLVRNQDIEFNYRLRKAGYRILLDPSVEVYYNPRRSIKAFWRQNFCNGIWNIITWKLVPGSLSWRHFVPLVFVMALFLSGFGAIFWNWARLLFFLVCASYLFADVTESLCIALGNRKLSLLFSFFVFPMLHFSYGLGSLWGIFFGSKILKDNSLVSQKGYYQARRNL